LAGFGNETNRWSHISSWWFQIGWKLRQTFVTKWPFWIHAYVVNSWTRSVHRLLVAANRNTELSWTKVFGIRILVPCTQWQRVAISCSYRTTLVSTWTTGQSVAMRFNRLQSTLYLILLTRRQIQSQPRTGCVSVAPWRSVLWYWLTLKGKMHLCSYIYVVIFNFQIAICHF
jgi:hypothetical protein